MKILIVDDSFVMRKVIENDIKDLNLEIAGVASDGKEALEQFSRLMPNLVTLDITMPKMDGLACLREMLKVKPSVKVVMVTALSDKGTVLQALKAGAKGYIAKPFSTDKLRQTLKRVMES